MEFAEHGDARKAMKSMKKAGQHLHGEVVRLWLHQMLEGLAYVHSKHVIHRDLKTANVFLTNQWRRSLIGDFGEALAVENRTVFANECVGTPYYMAPEIFKKQPYDAAIDMWAIGAICYELMALQRPFECKRGVQGASDRLLTLALHIANEEPNMEPLHRAGYSERLIRSVMRMLSKDPSKRPKPDLLLKDIKLWSDFHVADSEWRAMEAFGISKQARGIDHERIAIRDQSIRITTEESGRSACSSPSATSMPSSPSIASGCSSPQARSSSTVSGVSSPSNASVSSGWASTFTDQVKTLIKAAASNKTAAIQALLL
jgi:serine/threonine protein kinase